MMLTDGTQRLISLSGNDWYWTASSYDSGVATHD